MLKFIVEFLMFINPHLLLFVTIDTIVTTITNIIVHIIVVVTGVILLNLVLILVFKTLNTYLFPIKIFFIYL